MPGQQRSTMRRHPYGPVRAWLDDETGSVPALRVAVIEASRWFRDHAEQQSRRIAHHLPGMRLLHPLSAQFLQPAYLGRQIVSVNIDVNPGSALAEPLDKQPEVLAVQHGPVVFGVAVEPGQRLSGRRTPERQLPVMISRRDIDHDLGQPTVMCHPASLRVLAAARAAPTRPANDGPGITHYPRQMRAFPVRDYAA